MRQLLLIQMPHFEIATRRMQQSSQGWPKEHKQLSPLCCRRLSHLLNSPKDKSRTLSARYYKDGSEILIVQEGKNPRRLTPRECARLMGFDTSRLPEMIIPVSDTQAYQQFGNSVVVPVIKVIAQEMKPYILKLLKK